MPPPNEGVYAHDRAAAQIHLGVVLQQELLSSQWLCASRSPETGGHRPRVDSCVFRRNIFAAPTFLGAIHGDVRMLEQGLRV